MFVCEAKVFFNVIVGKATDTLPFNALIRISNNLTSPLNF